MACFLVSAAVGIVAIAFGKKVPEEYHINWLNYMIWGGVLALLVEHIWHGEVVLWPPFLTAMNSSADTTTMLTEMAEIGIPMLLAIVAAWIVMVVVYNKCIASAKNWNTVTN